ncbi:hypothetical protein ACLKA7_012123, partial [Drosophila subpalustris]
FNEDARPGSGSQQGAKPKQAAELNKPAPPNPEAVPLRTLVPEVRSGEYRPVDLRSSHWRNPFSDRDNWRVEKRRANDFSNEDSSWQDYDGGPSRSS